jgi:hypothetical protein
VVFATGGASDCANAAWLQSARAKHPKIAGAGTMQDLTARRLRDVGMLWLLIVNGTRLGLESKSQLCGATS